MHRRLLLGRRSPVLDVRQMKNVFASSFAMGMGLGMLLHGLLPGRWWLSLAPSIISMVFAVRAWLDLRKSKRALQESTNNLDAVKKRFAARYPDEARRLGITK